MRYHLAEKQLIAFFVNKHLVLPQGLEEADLGRLDLKALADIEYDQREGKRRHKENIFSLESMKPSISMKTATILVCRPRLQALRQAGHPWSLV